MIAAAVVRPTTANSCEFGRGAVATSASDVGVSRGRASVTVGAYPIPHPMHVAILAMHMRNQYGACSATAIVSAASICGRTGFGLARRVVERS
jgi:hypothetical protein